MPEDIQAKKPARHFLSLDRADFLALLICFGVFFIWLNLLIKKFINFGYYDWDLAMYAQAVWALSQGSLHSSLFGTTFLTNHAEYIAFFLAPIYKLFPSAFTLIVFKILSLVAGSFVFYLITKKLLGWRLGLVFMILYLLHPANTFMMIYEFHFENLAIFFIFAMYYFFSEKRLIPFLICAFFATIVKENISLIVFMFGFYALFTKRTQKLAWVIGPVLLGGVFFLLTMFVITPHLRMQEGIASANQYLSMYLSSSDQTGSIVQRLIHSLSALWHNFSSPLNQKYMIELFIPFHILPFLSPLTFLLGAPILLQHFLAPSHTMHSLYYHYAATAIIFIYLATVQTLSIIKNHRRPFLYICIIIITAINFSLYLRMYLPPFQNKIALWEDRLDPARQNMLQRIPKDASVVASFNFLAQLTSRKDLFSLHNVWQNYEPFTGKTPFVVPNDLSYLLIDWNCPWLRDDLLYSTKENSNNYLKQIHALYFARSWETIDAIEDITLLSASQTNDGQRLVENSQSFFSDSPKRFDISIGEHLKLLDLQILPINVANKSILPLELVWQSTAPINDLLAIHLSIVQKNQIRITRKHVIGYAFNATPLWEKNQYVKERYNLLLPALERGEYILNISIFNISKKKLETISFNNQKSNNLNLLKFTLKEMTP
ncbi:MAG: DUF2079 domain-containing protein [Candidatus Omnitrophica bacterium]|nr:DUF2079 domain-containing protein [Candidatus Omnitrophota bacterium]